MIKFLLFFISCSTLFSIGELTILIDHREYDSSLKEKARYRAIALANRACDKGSGTFGHAWIWIRGITQEKSFVDLEIGHTGETDPLLPTYLEQFTDAILDEEPNPAAIFYRDRNDGSLQLGSGGHYPQVALGCTLDDKQFNQLLGWLKNREYHFKRYNLVDHQCCHFVLEALKQIGIEIAVKPQWQMPQAVFIGSEKMILWKDPSYAQMPILTPWQLFQILKHHSQFQDHLKTYLAAKKAYSLFPWKRAWQKRFFLKQLVQFAPMQLQRECWARKWQEVENF
jgi:hypothetical protein